MYGDFETLRYHNQVNYFIKDIYWISRKCTGKHRTRIPSAVTKARLFEAKSDLRSILEKRDMAIHSVSWTGCAETAFGHI